MNRRTIVITGTSTGFGRDTAETLAGAGHTVFATMRDVEGKNREHADALRRQSIGIVELDVSSDASVERAMRTILGQTDRIDVLINNAGIASAGVTESFTPDQAKAVFNVNVVGVLRTTRAVLPTLRRQKDGLIVNVGSILGRVTFPFFGIYGASKFALEALTDSLRYELSPFGVDVTLVQPSAYPTPMYTSMQQPGDLARAAEYGDVGKIPTAMFDHFMTVFNSANAPNPHDVAEAILNVIALPRGKRPSRAVVGSPFGADAVNRQIAPVQSEVVRQLGLGYLDLAAST
jgi:NAD(P)-dependent dehydrogenase (short-subunit alcohol dehydrogenase family)